MWVMWVGVGLCGLGVVGWGYRGRVHDCRGKQYWTNLLLSLITFYVMYERVYEKFHTIQQTIVGMFIGILFGKIGFNIYASF